MKWNKLKTASLRLTTLCLILPCLPIYFLSTGCASLGGGDELELKENIRFKPNYNFKHYAFKTGYVLAGQQMAYATWSLCHNPKQEGIYILVGDITVDDQHRGLCLSKLTQAFLNGPYSVLVIPTTGMGADPADGSWLKKQISATEAILTSYTAKDMLQPQAKKGFWFAESSTVLGGIVAKKMQKKDPNSLQKVIFEQGMYDLNQVFESTASSTIKGQLANLKKLEPGALDNYSLAYDFEDLPHSVFLYHGEKNQEIPLKQAEDFATALQSGNFAVKFVKIPELAAKIDEDIRFQILRKAIASP